MAKKKPSAATHKKYKKSVANVKKAQKNLNVKLKQHHQAASAMFFFV